MGLTLLLLKLSCSFYVFYNFCVNRYSAVFNAYMFGLARVSISTVLFFFAVSHLHMCWMCMYVLGLLKCSS